MQDIKIQNEVIQSLTDEVPRTTLEDIKSIYPILDIPSVNPGFGFENKAKTLANLIKNAKQGQINLGIFGGYGSGKTTLMQRIKYYLDVESQQDSGIITIDFNAWRYDHERFLFIPFLDTLRRAMLNRNITWCDKTILSAIRGFLRGTSFEFNLGVTKLSFSTKGALEAERKFLEDRITRASGDYEDVYDALKELPLKDGKINKRIIIFVDDLDRCVPRRAFALLEQIKSLMNMKGYIFVFGIDQRVIDSYLRAKYKDLFVTSSEYIQKMFQISINLPEPSSEEISMELKKCLIKSDEEWLRC